MKPERDEFVAIPPNVADVLPGRSPKRLPVHELGALATEFIPRPLKRRSSGKTPDVVHLDAHMHEPPAAPARLADLRHARERRRVETADPVAVDASIRAG